MSLNAQAVAKALDSNYQTSGKGFLVGCPCHDDRNASCKVSDGDNGGIVIHCHAGCDKRDLVAELKDRNLWPKKEREASAPRRTSKPKPANDDFGAPAPEPKKKAAPLGPVVATYDYFDHLTGELVMKVTRHDPKTFRQSRPENGRWVFNVGPEHRTHYNAIRVHRHDKVVFVVEGEKDVDNLAAIGITATCNPAGAGKWQDSYSEILRGKDVILVPDNDPQMVKKNTGQLMFHDDGRPKHAGQDHMDMVGASLQGIAARVRILHLPDLPLKGDISDWLEIEGNDRARLAELCENIPEWTPPMAPDCTAIANQPVAPWTPSADAGADHFCDAPFLPLGHNHGTYYYLSSGSQQIAALSASGHTKANLFALAPLHYWQREYSRRGGFDVDAATSDMISTCHRKGIFSPELVRGRGAWWDDGRIVLHCGDRVYVDKAACAPNKVLSMFIYEQGMPMRADNDNPLSVVEATAFLDLVKMMPWARPVDALFVAGWCAIAHIGGVLGWRPHIWVVGAKGSGKSHVMSKVIRPILGDSCLFVASETTEAGIRQSLGSDAIPVLFDEAEGEDLRAHERLQRILGTIRQSSSETGAKLIKGSTNGTAMSFQIRSCFALSSINASLVQQSDRSRVTVVELKKQNQRVPFNEVLAAERQLIDETFVQRFHARAIAQAAIIRENVTTFAQVATTLFGDHRAGDQYGTLLAGAYSLETDAPATYEQAKAWVEQYDWAEDQDDVRSMSDETACLQYILQQMITNVDMSAGKRDLSVAELIAYAQEEVQGDGDLANSQCAHRALKRIGIKVDDDCRYLQISNTADGIKRLLKGTPWATNWKQTLKRIEGSSTSKRPVRFSASFDSTRAVRVPLPMN